MGSIRLPNTTFPDTQSGRATWGRAVVDALRGLVTSLSGYLPLTGGMLTGDLIVPDDAYDATTWNGNLEAPTKNALRDKIETISAGGVSDGDKGDITVSGSGATWTIDNGVVTLAKQANMATASVVYRKTAGAGAPEVQTLATLKTDLGLTGTNSGDQTITLTGDVTGSGAGSFAATIGNNAVTYAKFQDASAGNVVLTRANSASGDYGETSLAASQLLGRGSTGDIAAISLSGMAMVGTTLTGGWREAKWWNQAVDGSASTIECDVTGAKEILVLGNELTNTGAVQRIIQFSVDGGSSWFTTSGNYDEMTTAGVLANNVGFFTHVTPSGSARSFAIHVQNNGFGRTVHAFVLPRAIQVRFKGSATAINRVRVAGTADGTTLSGTYNGGTIQFLIR